MTDRVAHWDRVYTTRDLEGVSWYQPRPEVSLELVQAIAPITASVIDVGAGASALPDSLLEAGFTDVTALDVSPAALAHLRARLGDRVHTVAADLTAWQPARTWDVWHDRAVFHFLTTPDDRAAYRRALEAAVPPGGFAIVGTFAPDGPERCSGLAVQRWSSDALHAELGPAIWQKVAERDHDHPTPGGAVQAFQFTVLRRR